MKNFRIKLVNKFKSLKLKHKISMIILATVLTVLIIYISFVFNSASKIIENEVNKNLNMVEFFYTSRIENNISSLDSQIHRVVNDANITAALEMLDTMLTSTHNIDDARTLIQSTIGGTYSLATGQSLYNCINDIEQCEFAYITLTNGITVIDSRIRSVEDLEDEGKYLYKILRESEYKNIKFGQIEYINNTPYILYMKPIILSNHKISGHLVLGLTPDFMNKGFETVPEENGEFMLINKNGIILKHPEENRFGSKIDDFWYLEQINTNKISGKSTVGNDYLSLSRIKDNIYLAVSIPNAEMYRPIRRLSTNMALISILIIIISTLLIYIFINKELKPLDRFLNSFNAMSSGRLNEKVFLKECDTRRMDDIGIMAKTFNNTIRTLRELVTNIKNESSQLRNSTIMMNQNSREIGSISEEIGASMEELAAGAENQQEKVDNTQDNIFKFNEQIKLIEDKSMEISTGADNVINNIEKGNLSVEKSIQKINYLNQNTAELSSIIDNLGKKSQEIEEITNFIKHISKQTNLLALNAAIEASKAGQAGKGFSVVADEIRILAEQSSEATENITQLIETIQKKVSQAVKVTEFNQQSAEESVISVKNTESIFKEIKNLSTLLSKSIKVVADSLVKMAGESQEVKNAVDEISIISSEFASNSQQVTASSEEQITAIENIINTSEMLNKMSRKLMISINRFEL